MQRLTFSGQFGIIRVSERATRLSLLNRNLWEVRLICQIIAVAVSIVILVDLKQSKIVRDATCIRDSHFGALVRFMHVLQAKFYLIVESVVISLVKN